MNKRQHCIKWKFVNFASDDLFLQTKHSCSFTKFEVITPLIDLSHFCIFYDLWWLGTMHSPTLINRLRVLLKWKSSKKSLILFHLTIREVFSKLTVMMINHLICTQILTFLTLWYIHVRVRMRDITTVFLKFQSKNSQLRQRNSGPNFFII